MSDSRTLTDQQRYSLIYEVVCTYVYQVFKAIFAPIDQRYERRPWDNPLNWTGLWETASEEIVTLVAPHFNDIETVEQGESRQAEIAGKARTEMKDRIDIGETDFRIGHTEAWDNWLTNMQEDNWGEEEGYYIDDAHFSDQLDETLEELTTMPVDLDHDPIVQLRLTSEPQQTWTRKSFLAYHSK